MVKWPVFVNGRIDLLHSQCVVPHNMSALGCLETSDLENTDLENSDPLKIEMYYGHAITTRTIYVFINFERIRFRFTAVATGKKIARSGVDAKVKS